MQVTDAHSAQQGSQAMESLKQLSPRIVIQQLFAVKAQMSLAAAAGVASRAPDNTVLLSGVREVQQLTDAALRQPVLSKHQLAKLCQVSLPAQTLLILTGMYTFVWRPLSVLPFCAYPKATLSKRQ